jgi:hypothetical protein
MRFLYFYGHVCILGAIDRQRRAQTQETDTIAIPIKMNLIFFQCPSSATSRIRNIVLLAIPMKLH